MLQTLGEKTQALGIPPQKFEQIAALAAEGEDGS
jgi:hypothetical protein